MPSVGGQPQRSPVKPKTIPFNFGKQLAPIQLHSASLSVTRNMLFSAIFICFQANWEFVWKSRIGEFDWLNKLALASGIFLSSLRHVRADEIIRETNIGEIDHDEMQGERVFRSEEVEEQ